MAVLGTDVDARPRATPASPEVVVDEPVATGRASGWMRRNWEVLALAVAAIVVALAVQHFVYPAFSWNRDEVTYLWQVDGLSAGKVLMTDGGAPQFFWPWLAGHTGTAFFAQYTLGWPLVLLAAQTVFGSPLLSLAFGTALAVLGTYAFTRELTGDRSLALLAGVFMLASPVVVIQSGTYLGYLFSLGLGLLFGTALIAGLRHPSTGLLLVAGALLGWLLLTRPLDAILWAAPFAGYAVVVYWRRWRKLASAAVVVAVSFLPFLAVTLLYNRHISGSFTTFPLTAKDPLDTFGFGFRRLAPGAALFSYSGRAAVESTLDNLRVLPRFLFGGFVGVAAAAVGLWLRRRDRSTLALLFLALAFPFGYFFFWGNLLSTAYSGLSSPVYYIPLYFPLCVLLATVVLTVWRRHRVAAVALCAVLVLVTLASLVPQIRVNHRISAAQEPWRDSATHVRGPALVFVANAGDYLLHLNPYSRNGRNLDGRLLYAVDRGADDIDLMAMHPDRVPYLQVTTDPRWDNPINYHDASPPDVSLVPLSVLEGNTIDLRVRATNTGGDRVVVAYLEVGGQLVDTRVLSTDAADGEEFMTDWRLAAPDTAAGLPDVMALPYAKGAIRVGLAAGSSAEEALAGRQAQQRLPYRIDNSGRVGLVFPGRAYVGQRVRHHHKFHPVAALPGLDVQVTTNR